MIFEEFSILTDSPGQLLPFLLIQVNRRTFLEVIIFLGRSGVFISCFSSIPRTLDIIPLYDLLLSIEDISHDNEVAPTDLIALIVFFYQLMQAEELSNQGIRVLLEIIVVILEDSPKKFILTVADGLEHVLAICSVVEERSTFTLAGQWGHGVYLAHHQRSHQSVGANAADVVLVIDFEDLANMVESVRSIVSEGINSWGVLLIPESPRN